MASKGPTRIDQEDKVDSTEMEVDPDSEAESPNKTEQQIDKTIPPDDQESKRRRLDIDQEEVNCDDDDLDTDREVNVEDSSSDVGMENEIAQEKLRMGAAFRRLSRNDLEQLVLAKVVEAIVSHTEAGRLRSQVFELKSQKDKMAGRIKSLQNSVTELRGGLEAVLKKVEENTLQGVPTKRPNQIRFYRTVGIQVDVDKIRAINAKYNPPSPPQSNHRSSSTATTTNGVGRSEGGQQGQGQRVKPREEETPPPPIPVVKKHVSNKEPLEFVDLTEDDDEPHTSSTGTSTADLDLKPQPQPPKKTLSIPSHLIVEPVDVAPPKVAAVIPKVCAIIPTRPPVGGVLGPSGNNPPAPPPPKFVLPALPMAPPAKAGAVVATPSPKPKLTVLQLPQGITMSWDYDGASAKMANYQIYNCMETLKKNAVQLRKPQWNMIAELKALPLPMTCKFSQFPEGNRYYFIVRGIDELGRAGAFSEPQSLIMRKTV